MHSYLFYIHTHLYTFRSCHCGKRSLRYKTTYTANKKYTLSNFKLLGDIKKTNTKNRQRFTSPVSYHGNKMKEAGRERKRETESDVKVRGRRGKTQQGGGATTQQRGPLSRRRCRCLTHWAAGRSLSGHTHTQACHFSIHSMAVFLWGPRPMFTCMDF